MHIKKGDTVAIISGKDKGKEGKVLVAVPDAKKVVVEGINIQKRHTKPKSAQKTGGIIEQAGAIDVSNVMIICPKCKKATRVAMQFDEKGKKFRMCKKEGCGENLDKKLEKAEKKAVDKTDKKALPASKKEEGKAEKKTAAKAEVKTEKKAPAKKTDKADKAE